MDMYTSMIQQPKLVSAIPINSANTAALSEQNLNRHVHILHAKRVKLQQERGSTPDLRSHEETPQQAAEMELSEYLAEPLHPASTGAAFQDVLSYWKVCCYYLVKMFL
jgi:hypothetical protein